MLDSLGRKRTLLRLQEIAMTTLHSPGRTDGHAPVIPPEPPPPGHPSPRPDKVRDPPVPGQDVPRQAPPAPSIPLDPEMPENIPG